MELYDGEIPYTHEGLPKIVSELDVGQSYAKIERMDISYGYNPKARKLLHESCHRPLRSVQVNFAKRYPKRQYTLEWFHSLTQNDAILLGASITRLR